ncbi:hypothetical protein SNE25_15375 [Mucilaginibacter sabulilitoris]|uniref:Uncharacterized protein n=1 Tax=Mucilaginibacter sabulilitoris TaxID=1173583 RepID=A0ABZ0TUY9_9SPHI|nr:hypothetical protein [Mucilaginibacter sabulilitoris]WPU96901.1 hypothetical protein SNE25_15375 [Mucilaginibacter sabulilitoris]
MDRITREVMKEQSFAPSSLFFKRLANGAIAGPRIRIEKMTII